MLATSPDEESLRALSRGTQASDFDDPASALAVFLPFEEITTWFAGEPGWSGLETPVTATLEAQVTALVDLLLSADQAPEPPGVRGSRPVLRPSSVVPRTTEHLRADGAASSPSNGFSLGGAVSYLGAMVDRGGVHSDPGRYSDTRTEKGVTVTTELVAETGMDEQGRQTFEFGASAKGGGTTEEGQRGDLSIGFLWRAEGDVCPDPNGQLNFRISFRSWGNGKLGAKQAGGDAEINADVTVDVGEDAFIHSIDYRHETSVSEQDSTGKSVGAAVARHGRYDNMKWTPGSGDSTDLEDLTITEDDDPSSTKSNSPELTSDPARADRLADRLRMLRLVIDGYVQGLQAQWRDGRCVEIIAADPGRVKRGSTTTVDVAVKHKLTGSELKVPVYAGLTGKESISPKRITSPDSFRYTAPSGDKSEKATIGLTTVSKRGIAKKSLTASTGGGPYAASGGGANLSVGGVVDSVDGPFQINGQIVGGTVTFTYAPTSDHGGTVSYSGGGGGATMTGSGSYTLTPTDDGGYVLQQSTGGCVNIGKCRDNVDTITLTPVD